MVNQKEENRKEKIVALSLATTAILGLSSAYILSKQGNTKIDSKAENTVSYVFGGNKSTSKAKKGSDQIQKEKLSPEEVSKKEGITVEQIVIKITADGYVPLHGEHYHVYNGKVPYNAIISESLLMTDSSYHLKQEDIVNEVKNGYYFHHWSYDYKQEPGQVDRHRSFYTVFKPNHFESFQIYLEPQPSTIFDRAKYPHLRQMDYVRVDFHTLDNGYLEYKGERSEHFIYYIRDDQSWEKVFAAGLELPTVIAKPGFEVVKGTFDIEKLCQGSLLIQQIQTSIFQVRFGTTSPVIGTYIQSNPANSLDPNDSHRPSVYDLQHPYDSQNYVPIAFVG
ncbi:pneumococcal-type histidine triad protein [Streptococcus sp. 20-1249]|uniref:pneumococcal-type histidine triad protein n=1 Tax=Streptococcus hepaticus TaxID=3349163 RepID=UPI003749BE20